MVAHPYPIQSDVRPSTFRDFISIIEGNEIQITDKNVSDLFTLSTEFRFTDLTSEVLKFQRLQEERYSEQTDTEDIRRRLSQVEAVCRSRDRENANLRSELLKQSRKQETVEGRLSQVEEVCRSRDRENTNLRSELLKQSQKQETVEGRLSQIEANIGRLVAEFQRVLSQSDVLGNVTAKLSILEADVLSLKEDKHSVSLVDDSPSPEPTGFRDPLSRFAAQPTRFTERSGIGRASDCKIYRAKDTVTGKEVRLKVFDPDPDRSVEGPEFRELMALAKNDHPAILKLIGFCSDSSSNVPSEIATEFHKNGSLESFLKQERAGRPTALNATVKSKIMIGIVCGMASLHAHGFLHRKLRPSNILLNEQFEPIIGDFWLSCLSDGDTQLEGPHVPPVFMAPELINDGDAPSFPMDVYAFAITLYSMFAVPDQGGDGKGRPRNQLALMNAISQGHRLRRMKEIPDFHWEVIERCWSQHPFSRPTFQDLLTAFHDRHDYILPGSDRASVCEYENRVCSGI
jgi:hypothetical protein